MMLSVGEYMMDTFEDDRTCNDGSRDECDRVAFMQSFFNEVIREYDENARSKRREEREVSAHPYANRLKGKDDARERHEHHKEGGKEGEENGRHEEVKLKDKGSATVKAEFEKAKGKSEILRCTCFAKAVELERVSGEARESARAL